jgi:hypothetical protein
MQHRKPRSSGLIDRADQVLGAGLERLVPDHHRRRLTRIGQSGALSPQPDSGLCAQEDLQPRAGNSLEVLIDGERASGVRKSDRASCSVRCIRGSHGGRSRRSTPLDLRQLDRLSAGLASPVAGRALDARMPPLRAPAQRRHAFAVEFVGDGLEGHAARSHPFDPGAELDLGLCKSSGDREAGEVHFVVRAC